LRCFSCRAYVEKTGLSEDKSVFLVLCGGALSTFLWREGVFGPGNGGDLLGEWIYSTQLSFALDSIALGSYLHRRSLDYRYRKSPFLRDRIGRPNNGSFRSTPLNLLKSSTAAITILQTILRSCLHCVMLRCSCALSKRS
jgi:hypothetical protein